MEQRKIFPFKIVEDDLPASQQWKSAMIIVSASANNDYFLKVASDNDWPLFRMNHGFTEEEFKSWVTTNTFFIDQEMNEVEYWTSRVPYELRLLLEAKQKLPSTATLGEVTKDYLDKRTAQLNAQQEKFYREQLKGDERLQDTAIKSVVCMKLGLSAPLYVKINQQLMFIENDRIYPTTPRAEEVLTDFWDVSLTDALEKTIELIFSAPLSNFTADTKGRTQFLEIAIQKIDTTTEKDWRESHPIKLYVKDLIPLRFGGNSLPPKGKVDWTKPTLFIPTNCNYPNVDLLIWKPSTEELFPIQVTVRNPVSGHEKKFFEMNSHMPSEDWKLRANDELGKKDIGKKNGDKSITIKFLWIASNDSVDATMNDQYFASVDSLSTTYFPLVSRLRLD